MKTLRYISTLFLFTVTCSYAMDLTMVTIKPKRRFDSQIYQQKNYIDKLPLELQGKIIKDVFNLIIFEDDKSKKHTDQHQLEEYVLHIPLILGIKCAQGFYQLQKMCQDEIGSKRFLAQELFVLPRKHQDIFIRMANPSKIRSFIGINIGRDDFMELMAIENKSIKKGLQLHTVIKGEMLVYCIFGTLTMMLLCPPMMMILPEFSKANFVERVAIRISKWSFLSSWPLLLICGFFYDHGF